MTDRGAPLPPVPPSPPRTSHDTVTGLLHRPAELPMGLVWLGMTDLRGMRQLSPMALEAELRAAADRLPLALAGRWGLAARWGWRWGGDEYLWGWDELPPHRSPAWHVEEWSVPGCGQRVALVGAPVPLGPAARAHLVAMTLCERMSEWKRQQRPRRDGDMRHE